MTLSIIPGKIPETKKKIVINFLFVAYVATNPANESCSNSKSRVPLQISPAHLFNFRPTLKIRVSLHKKQANNLSDKHGILQTCSIVSVAKLLNQQERPPRKYRYYSSEIHCL